MTQSNVDKLVDIGSSLAGGARQLVLRGYTALVLAAAMMTLCAAAFRVLWIQSAVTRHDFRTAIDGLLNQPFEGLKDKEPLMSAAVMQLGYVDVAYRCRGNGDGACRAMRSWLRGTRGMLERALSSETPRPYHELVGSDCWAPCRRTHHAACASDCAIHPAGHPEVVVPAFLSYRRNGGDPFSIRAREEIHLATLAAGSDFRGEMSAAGAQWAQVFFVSTEGVIGLWPRDGSSPPSQHRNVNSRGGTYVDAFLRDDARQEYETEPYVDLGGNGIVRSLCVPVREPADPPRQAYGALRGVLCTDYLPPPNSAAAGQRPGAVWIEHSRLLVTGTRHRWSIHVSDSSEPDVGELERELNRTSVDPAEFGDVIRLPSGAALVPLAKSRTGTRCVLVRARPPSFNAILWVAVIAGVATAGVFVWTLAVRRWHRWEEAQDVFLRNLQVGVVELGHDGTIVRGNDRAEELLGFALPSFAGTGRESISLDALFEDTCYEAGLPGHPDRWEHRRARLGDLCRDRPGSDPGRYFVRKHSALVGRPHVPWLELHCSPELVSRRAGSPRAFGSLDVPSDRRKAELDAQRRLDRILGGHRDS